MRLRDLPDWSNFSPLLGDGGVLKSARPSQLRHFVILDIEHQGAAKLRMIQVGSERIQTILSLLNAHIGKSIHEIGQLEVDD